MGAFVESVVIYRAAKVYFASSASALIRLFSELSGKSDAFMLKTELGMRLK
jgi:hypothetical protein